jgi:hypothetical protein
MHGEEVEKFWDILLKILGLEEWPVLEELKRDAEEGGLVIQIILADLAVLSEAVVLDLICSENCGYSTRWFT